MITPAIARKLLLQRTFISVNLMSECNCSKALYGTMKPSGAVLPEPKKTRYGLVGVICSVVAGLLTGAAISKTVANFLEENELFVPSDDDDDDD